MPTEQDKKGEVGFRKPPRSKRFKKGSSGNPKGRPPRASRDADILALLRSALNEEVTVTENGERKKITKAEAMAKQLVNKGAAGDARAIHLLLSALRSIEERLDSAAGEQAEETATQMHMLERLTIEERLELRHLIAKAQGEPADSEVGSEEAVPPSAAEDGKQNGR
jgi:Family of unknown function (DUF5681)